MAVIAYDDSDVMMMMMMMMLCVTCEATLKMVAKDN